MNTRFVFEGIFEVEASCRKEAKDIVKNECGLILGGNIHTTSHDRINWGFDMHPNMEVRRIKKCDSEIPEVGLRDTKKIYRVK